MTTVTSTKSSATTVSRLPLFHRVLGHCAVGLGVIAAGAMPWLIARPPSSSDARGPAVAIPFISSAESIAMDSVARELAAAGLNFTVVDDFGASGFVEFDPASPHTQAFAATRD
jgi:hypothetical protein